MIRDFTYTSDVRKVDKVCNPEGYQSLLKTHLIFIRELFPNIKKIMRVQELKELHEKLSPKKASKVFQATEDNAVIAERSKIVAKLHIEIGGIVISIKIIYLIGFDFLKKC